MAAALYEDEVAGDRYRDAQAKSSSAASKVSAMKGIGLTYNDYIASLRTAYGDAAVDAMSAAEKDQRYRSFAGMMSADELSVKVGRTVSNTEYMHYVADYETKVQDWQDALQDEETARVGTLIAGAAKKSMDSARSTMGVGPRASDVYTSGYRSQRQVRMTDDRVAIREDGGRILDPAENIDNRQRGTGADYRDQYTFEDSVTAFDGTIDDSSFGSSNRGS